MVEKRNTEANDSSSPLLNQPNLHSLHYKYLLVLFVTRSLCVCLSLQRLRKASIVLVPPGFVLFSCDNPALEIPYLILDLATQHRQQLLRPALFLSAGRVSVLFFMSTKNLRFS